MKIPCSVPILTLNSLDRLRETLPLLAEIFDDVFLVDGNSTDGTQEYAQSLGVRVEKQVETDEPNQRITDFPKARMESWKKCRYDWVLVLDADELVTPELVDEIRQITDKDDRQEVHWVRRYPVLPGGDVVKNSPFYNTPYCRLFTRSSGVTIADQLVHEKFILPKTVRSVWHEEAILCPEPSPQAFAARAKRYAILEGKSLKSKSVWLLIRWIIWYNIRSFFGQCLRVIKSEIVGHLRKEPLLPWSYTRVFLLYRWWSLREGVSAWSRLYFASS